MPLVRRVLLAYLTLRLVVIDENILTQCLLLLSPHISHGLVLRRHEFTVVLLWIGLD